MPQPWFLKNKFVDNLYFLVVITINTRVVTYDTLEREDRLRIEIGEREERDTQSLQGMSLQFHFQFQNALISKCLNFKRDYLKQTGRDKTRSSFHTLFCQKSDHLNFGCQ